MSHSYLKFVIIPLKRLENLQKNFNKTFFNLYLRDAARKVKKGKKLEMIKRELLTSLVEYSHGEEEYLELNEEVRKGMRRSRKKDGIALVKKYENLLKGTNKKIINILGKQGKILKRFRDEDEFFDRVGLN